MPTSRYDYMYAIVNQTVLKSDQIRQYRSVYAHCVMEGIQRAC